MNTLAFLTWSTLFLPLAGTVVIATLGNRLGRAGCAVAGNLAAWGAFVAAWGSFFLWNAGGGGALSLPLVRWAAPGGATLSLGLLVDPLSLVFVLVVTGVAALVHAYSVGYMAHEPRPAFYFASLNLFVFTMLLLVLADGFVPLLFGWAGVGLSSFLLIGFWHERPSAVRAARKAFIMNAIGDVGIVAAMLLLFRELGTLGFEEVFYRIPELTPAVATGVALCLLVGAVAKSAQLPLHTWLPDAMEGPTPVSALLHSATMVTAGVYLVARAHPIFQASPAGMETVAWVGAATAIFAATIGATQFDIKRVLAYSTMSQIGYMFMAVGAGAYAAGVFHFMTQAFFKALLFMVAGIVIHALAGEQDMRRMGGLARRLPFAYWTMVVGVLAISGAPGFAGFFSKDAILSALAAGGGRGLWAAGVVTAGITAYYMFRLLFLVFGGESRAEAEGGGDVAGSTVEHAAAPPSMVWPTAILAVLSVAGGWIAVPGAYDLPAAFLDPVFETFKGVKVLDATLDGVTLGLTVALAAAGFAAAYFRYRLRFGPRALEVARRGLAVLPARRYFVDEIYDTLVVRPGNALAALVNRIVDSAVVDGLVGGVVQLAVALAHTVSALQSGRLRRYALTIATAAVFVTAYFAGIA